MTLHSYEAGKVHRPAPGALDQLASDVHGGDVRVVHRVRRGAGEPHDLQHVAVAGIAVEDLDDQRLGLRRPALLLRREVVEHAEEDLGLESALRERAVGDLARAQRAGQAAEQAPALGERIGAVKGELPVDPGARGVNARYAVVVVVQGLIAQGNHRVRPQPEPPAPPFVPVSEVQLGALRSVRGVA